MKVRTATAIAAAVAVLSVSTVREDDSRTVRDRAVFLASEFVRKREGFRANVYNDSGGRETIGYGHLLKAGETMRHVSESQALKLLADDLALAANEVEAVAGASGLNVYQRAAIYSFVFNVGVTQWRTSRLRGLIVARLFDRVPGELRKWVYVTDRATGIKSKNQGLINRRELEVKLFLESVNNG